MQRSYKLDGLCCANCAAEMEREINKLDDVQSASIAFMSQRLNIDATDPEKTLDDVQTIITRIERDCRIVR